MLRIALALAVATAISSPALAQTPTPLPSATFARVPSDAVLSHNLIGLNVENGAKETVGQIKDLVLQNGQLVGYVLSVGGFLGIGEHYVVVQPASIGVAWDESANKWQGTINALKEELKGAPEFKYERKFKG
jgi:hypothetical protein